MPLDLEQNTQIWTERKGCAMRKHDVDAFIEEMAAIGDDWTPEQVENVYGDSSLGEALADRNAAVGSFFDIIGKLINLD